MLYKAVIPELRGEVLTGEDGAPLVEPTRRDELFSTMEVARRIGFALAKGDAAKRELDGTDAPTIDTVPELIPEPEPEAPDGARGIVSAPERGGALGALDADGVLVPDPLVSPAGQPWPPHAYIYLEEGALERSGCRAWLAMESPAMILRTFHGTEARRLAREWVAAKFRALPAEEIEVPLPEEISC